MSSAGKRIAAALLAVVLALGICYQRLSSVAAREAAALRQLHDAIERRNQEIPALIELLGDYARPGSARRAVIRLAAGRTASRSTLDDLRGALDPSGDASPLRLGEERIDRALAEIESLVRAQPRLAGSEVFQRQLAIVRQRHGPIGARARAYEQASRHWSALSERAPFRWLMPLLPDAPQTDSQ